MDPQTKAKIEFDVAQFKARQRQGAGQQRDYSESSKRMRACVFAHAAFSLIDQAIAEHVDCLHAQGVHVDYSRNDTAIVVSLGLRRATFALKLHENAVGIAFFTASPYPGGADTAEFATPWPADVVPIEYLDGPIKVFMDDMRAFLLNGKRPS